MIETCRLIPQVRSSVVPWQQCLLLLLPGAEGCTHWGEPQQGTCKQQCTRLNAWHATPTSECKSSLALPLKWFLPAHKPARHAAAQIRAPRPAFGMHDAGALMHMVYLVRKFPAATAAPAFTASAALASPMPSRWTSFSLLGLFLLLKRVDSKQPTRRPVGRRGGEVGQAGL